MVMKDCVIPAQFFRDPVQWRDGLPKEIALHRRIDRKRKRDRDDHPKTNMDANDSSHDSGFDNVIASRGYRLMMFKRRYRLYLDYYACKELCDHVWKKFVDWRREVLPEDELTIRYQGIPTIDEKFIWYVFRSLVKGLLILHEGTTDPN